jgi:glycosyltransferase involved in cell wall biosynthesis
MRLTIGIPTFNRAAYLSETLDCILSQLPAGSENEIEILISDNGSWDNTEILCREYSQLYPFQVRYVRHNENQGFDRNLDSLFINALGLYVLLIGDDDYPLPGALNLLLHLIDGAQDEIPAIIFSYHKLIEGGTGKNLELRENFFQPLNKPTLNFAKFKTAVELLRSVQAPLNGGLTGTIFLRSAWLASDRKSYIGTNFLQLAVAYQVAVHQSVYIVYKPLFVVRMNSDHRWPVNGELYFGLLKAGRPLALLYPSDIVKQLRRTKDWAVRRAIMFYRGTAPKDRRLQKIIVDSLDRGRLGYWLLDLPLLMLPSRLCSMSLKLKQLFDRS